MQTLGEYRVGITFNPSNDTKVHQIKEAAAKFIDIVNTVVDDRDPEVVRLKALALTHAEDAAMWGVKAATKPVKENDNG